MKYLWQEIASIFYSWEYYLYFIYTNTGTHTQKSSLLNRYYFKIKFYFKIKDSAYIDKGSIVALENAECNNILGKICYFILKNKGKYCIIKETVALNADLWKH